MKHLSWQWLPLTYQCQIPIVKSAIRHKIISAKRAKKNIFTEFLSIDEAVAIFNYQNGKCFYTGEILTHEAGKHNSLSMDRKNSKIGYTTENVVFCCSIINYMKQTLLPEEFLNWCRKVTAYGNPK